MREALGPPGGGSEGGPSTYMDAAKAGARQLQTLGPLIAAIGQAQLLQQRTECELRSMSRSGPFQATLHVNQQRSLHRS